VRTQNKPAYPFKKLSVKSFFGIFYNPVEIIMSSGQEHYSLYLINSKYVFNIGYILKNTGNIEITDTKKIRKADFKEKVKSIGIYYHLFWSGGFVDSTEKYLKPKKPIGVFSTPEFIRKNSVSALFPSSLTIDLLCTKTGKVKTRTYTMSQIKKPSTFQLGQTITITPGGTTNFVFDSGHITIPGLSGTINTSSGTITSGTGLTASGTITTSSAKPPETDADLPF
jgi:hypothetical protein